ncbi:hypothetical protein [Nitrosopumilus adriaticus]|uniref:Uncharacterized protein n=1 Tax=Nitrosopumilus adriaticus TaxID=1580092 RepID=A0A0D5C1V5_9ARCH|nr:hypothetical protein [Nitrosopumilus adriaticus]AJW70295.1 membrane protein of unknown function [Nitrosopumilus adriaticus]
MALPKKLQRPHGITIVAIWFVLEGIYYFYTHSIGMFGGANLLEIFADDLVQNSLTAYGLGLAMFNFVVAWAFWDGKAWIRIPTIIVLSTSVIVTWILFSFQLASAFESILSTALTGVVIIYLLKSSVKKYFEQCNSGF